MKKRYSEEQIIGFLREAENGRLKRAGADLTVDKQILKEVLEGK